MTYFQSAKDEGEADARTMRVVHAGDVGASVNVLNTSIPVSQVSGAIWSTSLATALDATVDSISTYQASGAVFSVYVKEIWGSTITTLLNGDNRIPVSVETGGSGLTDSELRASSVPVEQVSGSVWSTYITGSNGTVGVVTINPDGLPVYGGSSGGGLTDTELRASSVPVEQVSGSIWSTYIAGAVGTLAANIVDSTGVAYSGSNPVPVVFSASGTSAVNLVDSTGVAYSGSNPVPVNNATALDYTIDSISAAQVSGAVFSVYSTGALDSMTTFMARTTNPTVKTDGADVRPTTDDLGRQLSRPVQVRDLIITAYATENEIQETTILAGGGAGVYHDLIFVTAANASSGAITLEFRATTGGNVMFVLNVPPYSTAGLACPVPYKAGDADASWTVKNNASDNSNTTYYVSAQFTKEL